MSNSRVARGRASEKHVADYWRQHGFPYCEPVGAFRPGADLTGTPGISVEVKARAGLSLPAWMRQAEQAAEHCLPILIVRNNGQGPASIGNWSAVLRHHDLMQLLHDAGWTDHE